MTLKLTFLFRNWELRVPAIRSRLRANLDTGTCMSVILSWFLSFYACTSNRYVSPACFNIMCNIEFEEVEVDFIAKRCLQQQCMSRQSIAKALAADSLNVQQWTKWSF